MKKLIVLGIVVTLVMGLAVAASAYTKDTDWQVYFSMNNGVFTTSTQSYGLAGTDVKVGVKAAASTVGGTSPSTSTYAYVRDTSAPGTGFGLTTNYKTWAPDQAAAAQVMEWTNIEIWANSGYVAPVLKFMAWGLSIDADGPALQVICTQAVEGSGFTVGEIIYDSIATSTKGAPGYVKDLSAYIATYKQGSQSSPIATFKVVATVPALPVQDTPEPGSMVALFSGLVGLVGFGIRRRK